MKATNASTLLAIAFLATLVLGGHASAAPILCQTPTINHMLIDDSQVSACLAAGQGNPSLTGNPANDTFLTGAGAGLGYVTLGKDDEGPNPFNVAQTQSNGTGTWSFDASVWNDYSTIAIGFKFGTGNKPDDWFVFQVVSNISSGLWEFVNVYGTGGGLSHVNLYGILGDNGNGGDPPAGISEPGVLLLLGAGLMGLAWVRRRHEVG